MRQSILLSILFILCLGKAYSLENKESVNAQEEIVSALKKWPQEFNKRNVQGVCSLFAPDLVASYLGTLDRNYEAMCRHLSAILTDPDRQFCYEAPEIEEILIERDMAVVRLIWTLKVFDKKGTEVSRLKEKGLDVFNRQKDGSWKVVISYAYPEENL